MVGFVFRSGSAPLRAAATRVRVRVAVALTEDAVDRIHEVAAACRALGFAHDSTLRSVGVLTGSADFRALRTLRNVPGVLLVETERVRSPRSPSRGA